MLIASIHRLSQQKLSDRPGHCRACNIVMPQDADDVARRQGMLVRVRSERDRRASLADRSSVQWWTVLPRWTMPLLSTEGVPARLRPAPRCRLPLSGRLGRPARVRLDLLVSVIALVRGGAAMAAGCR